MDGTHHEIENIDFYVYNQKNWRQILCNLFLPKELPNSSLVVYLHGYQGNKKEGIPILDTFLPHRAVLLLDLPGHGNSEMNYTTLGYDETFDLHNILNEVLCYFNFSSFYLLGRSIGAVTIINMV